MKGYLYSRLMGALAGMIEQVRRRRGREMTTLDPRVAETHTGLVVLAGELAYKIKKPVVTDFLDFSDVAQR